MWLIQAMAVGSHGIIIFMILAFTKVRSPRTLVVMISGLDPQKVSFMMDSFYVGNILVLGRLDKALANSYAGSFV